MCRSFWLQLKEKRTLLGHLGGASDFPSPLCIRKKVLIQAQGSLSLSLSSQLEGEIKFSVFQKSFPACVCASVSPRGPFVQFLASQPAITVLHAQHKDVRDLSVSDSHLYNLGMTGGGGDGRAEAAGLAPRRPPLLDPPRPRPKSRLRILSWLRLNWT